MSLDINFGVGEHDGYFLKLRGARFCFEIKLCSLSELVTS